MRATCFDNVLRLGYTAIGGCSVVCFIAAVVTDHWIHMQEPFDVEGAAVMTEDPMNSELQSYNSENYEEGPLGEGFPSEVYTGEEYPGELLGEGYPGNGVLEDAYEGEVQNETGLPMSEVIIFARSGLWKVCFRLQMSNVIWDTSFNCIMIDYFTQAWNGRPQEGGRDTIMSIARGARKSTFPLLLSLLLSVFALFIGTAGNCKGRQNRLTMVGAVLYILSSLLVMLSVMLFMLAVNDEVGHRPKPRNTDPNLLFHYSYSWGVAFIVCGYVCCCLSVVTNVYIYQRGFHHRVQALLEDGRPDGGLPSVLTLLRGHSGLVPGHDRTRDHELLCAAPLVIQ